MKKLTLVFTIIALLGFGSIASAEFQSPTGPPGEGFVEPTSPPPYDNRPAHIRAAEDAAKAAEADGPSWWQRFTSWLAGIFG